MTEEKPFWQQLRDKKLGSTRSPEAVKRETKKDLAAWYEVQATQAPAACENCGRSLAPTIAFHLRAHIAHIVPKTEQGGCPSVGTHPMNRWFACRDCHDIYDKQPAEIVATMAIIPIVKKRLRLFVKEIAPAEQRKVPKFLL